MVGHYFNQAHLDVMAGVDHLIELGIADGDRMAKMGWSAGGHMTNKIITHTTRFKAASSGAGAVNWISMYGQSDVRFPRTPWFGGTPWQEDAPIDTYWGNSPLKDIYRVTTPTIVIVGENDVRVPPPQSVELYRALRTNGVDTHLYIAPPGAARPPGTPPPALQGERRARVVRAPCPGDRIRVGAGPRGGQREETNRHRRREPLTPDGPYGLERRSPTGTARRSAPRTSQRHRP